MNDKKQDEKPRDVEGEHGRGRPGRRSAAERREAVMAVIAGKSSIDQVAKQYGVLPSTVEGWRDAAVLAIEQAMAMGNSTPKERELEAKVDSPVRTPARRRDVATGVVAQTVLGTHRSSTVSVSFE